MEQKELTEIERLKEQLQEVSRPYQQEQNQRQKKFDFLEKCARCIEKNDFFQIDELLRSKQAEDILEDSQLKSCGFVFNQMKAFAETQIENYRIRFKDDLLQLAQEANLPLEMDLPRFSVLKGIEGSVDFSTRNTEINQVTLKSIDPRRIIATVAKLKCQLYDTPFDARMFIESLLQCYREILKKEGRGFGDIVPVHQLYTDYVWSLQSKTFFQNMDKSKFRGYAIEQFSVDLWRFFQSRVSATEEGYRIRLNPGRGKSFWLIDQAGEKRQITHVLFLKN